MIVIDPTTVIYSASDLTAAAHCEWALMHKLDARLGRVEATVEVEDDMLNRAAVLGDTHEMNVLAKLRQDHTVVEIERPDSPTDITAAASATTQAFRDGADVIYQAAFFDGRFLGYADFIQRSGYDDNGDAIYEVYDTKLARSAKITALLQLAAYSEQLHKIGIATGEHVYLILGDGKHSTHRLSDILPVYRKRRARLQEIIDGRVADPEPTPWGDTRYTACGHCDACKEQVDATRDVLLVANLRLTQRARLRAAVVTTIDQLAIRREPVDGISDATLTTLRNQAAVQLESTPAAPAWRFADSAQLGALPNPDDGDIFFDFEGDPLFQDGTTWGIDYLFGHVEADGTFVPFWAHDLAQERRALVDFLAYVQERRALYPAMHIYHYAAYERTHLLSLAARHGYGEEIVADLLRDHVLVDLYPIIRRGFVIGSHSYSLKKLEPLYMTTKRSGTDNAADSVTAYAHYAELAASGRADDAAAVLADIGSYNQYDCESTLALRNWLLDRANEAGVPLAQPRELELVAVEPEADPLYDDLAALIADTPPAERSADQTAIALAAAAIDYHRRENNSFWWDHFDRLRQPIEQWADTRDVLVIEHAIAGPWTTPKRGNPFRILEVKGIAAPGSSIKVGSQPYLVYDPPFPPNNDNIEPGARFAHNRSEITDVADDGTYTLTEKLRTSGEPYDELPIAFTPMSPPRAGVLVSAIHDWGSRVLSAWPEMLPDAALDILRRQPPRGGLANTDNTIADITATLLSLDNSYVAVQGPPGTGKTYTGSRVIADLVTKHGWRVGVVAQSHAAVENMLAGIVKAGLPKHLVGKKPKTSDDRDVEWTRLTDNSQAEFTSQDGFVIGGTAWTFANRNRMPLGELDLLVVDEAGQYSLANTIAAAGAATRLLLLGDPQQLPQVSQGQHPEPVDVSALGWLTGGHDVLPPEFGYFLDTSWRMHPAVCAPVSRLSYEGKLTSHASDRHLEGIEPGLHPVPVEHHDRSTSSPEEADAVVAIVRNSLGAPWSVGGSTAGLDQENVIVVAPYNAQVELLREALTAAGFERVPVGTVDKFQGQEAAIAIVSLAASSAAEVPRGLEFLLLANRLNVAISRAQWAAYLVYSPALTDTLPTSVAGLAQLSAFIDLVEPA